jgi:hypothetical protein
MEEMLRPLALLPHPAQISKMRERLSRFVASVPSLSVEIDQASRLQPTIHLPVLRIRLYLRVVDDFLRPAFVASDVTYAYRTVRHDQN